MTDSDRDRPGRPADIDAETTAALATLEDRDADRLREFGAYLEELAEWKASAAAEDEQDSTERASSGSKTNESEAETGTGDDDDVEYPDGVPERASVTVKKIAGTTYHYFQWRDGDRIESETVQRE